MSEEMKGSTVKWKAEVCDYSNDPPDNWFSAKLKRESKIF